MDETLPARIILADDHPVVTMGTKALIEQSGIGQVVFVAGNPSELWKALEDFPCDILVTDLSMPGGDQPDGLIMVSRIRNAYPNLPILLLSMLNSPGIIRSSIESGVRGFLDKSSSMSELIDALEAIQKGGNYISQEIRNLASYNTEHSNPHIILSPKEKEVIRLLARGSTVTEIARKFHRSVATISKQKASAMRKLNIDSDAKLFYLLERYNNHEQ